MRMVLSLFVTVVLVGGLGWAEEGSKVFTAKDRTWWAIQPVANPKAPDAGAGWVRNEIDRFIAFALEAADLKPASAADREELARRAYFDLHGLPPTPEQMEAFVQDQRPDAWERLVDELLASPRYGERWGQHWLDVVRFAESDGYRQDAFRPDAFRYRDWVIQSFNSDKPYDKFVAQQLAGDEIDIEDPDCLIGTAFLRNGLYEYNQRDVRFHWELILNELTNVTAEAFLGLGIGCAQCHDHKFDPLLQKDYYRLQAYLAPVRMRHDLPLANPEEKAEYQRKLIAWQEATAESRREIDAIVEPKIKKAMNDSLIKFPPDIQELFQKAEAERTPYEQQLMELAKIQLDYERERFSEAAIKGEERVRLDALRGELAKFEAMKPKALPRAFAASDVRNRAPVVPLGGRPGVGTGNVLPGIPSIMIPDDENIEFRSGASTGRRLTLATWITDPKNPLTPRVLANRIWQHHFERGIVTTPNDFGTLGEAPSHPELLDWLASRLIKNGWQLKPLHRVIMTSATYRQTARQEPNERAQREDPSNKLLWRFPPRRLDAEQARDAMLAVSGELKLDLGGASVSGDTPRRSIYVKKIRNSPDELLKALDAPMGFESTAARSSTTTATQSLQMINGPWLNKRAAAFARRLIGGRKEVLDADVRRAYRMALGREAATEEVEQALAFIALQRTRIGEQELKIEVDPKVPGVRPIALQFGAVDGIAFGESELQLQPGSPYERLHLREVELARDEFTVETVAILDGLYPNADVRTLASRWNSDKAVGGWTFGVTSTKSKYEPRNFIMQLIGRNSEGKVVYEVVASDLRVPLETPVYLAAAVSTTPTPESASGGTVTFYLKDLKDPKAALQSKTVSHSIVQGLQDPDVRLVLGGIDRGGRSLWDGEVARFALSEGVVAEGELLVKGAAQARVLDLKFTGGKPTIAGADWLRPNVKGPIPLFAAVTDFCHVLLTSNEFLYLH